MRPSIQLTAQSAEPAPIPGTVVPVDEIIARFLSTSARYLKSTANHLAQAEPDRPDARQATVISMADALKG